MPDTLKKDILTYDLRVVGIFGRNRKVKSEHFTFAEVPAAEPLTLERARELATKKLNEVKVKGKARVSVSETPQTLEEWTYTDSAGQPRTMVSRAFMLFSGKILWSEEVGA